MFCPNCGTNNVEGAVFCASCGTALTPEQPTQQPVEQPAQPYQAPYQQPVEQPYHAPYQQPVQQPYQAPYQQPVQQPYQAPYQAPYQQPYQNPYQQPVYRNTTVPGKGMGVTGMVLGIISLVLFCIWYLAIPCAIVGASLSGVAMKKAKDAGMKNGAATAGLVCSLIALGIAVLFIILVAAAIVDLSYYYYY